MDPTTKLRSGLAHALLPVAPQLAALHSELNIDDTACMRCGGHLTITTRVSRTAITTTCRVCRSHRRRTVPPVEKIAPPPIAAQKTALQRMLEQNRQRNNEPQEKNKADGLSAFLSML